MKYYVIYYVDGEIQSGYFEDIHEVEDFISIQKGKVKYEIFEYDSHREYEMR